MTTNGPTTDWDTPAVVKNGMTDQHVIVQRVGDRPVSVSVPPGETARSWAEILHGFDGYTVQGFGYGPDDRHPRDCEGCGYGDEPGHSYRPDPLKGDV